MATFAELVEATDRAAQTHLGGEDVVYQPAAGAAATVTGIFDAPHALAKGDPEAGVEVALPSVFLRLADLPTDPEDDDPILTIRGVAYRVTGRPGPDGYGGIVLTLRRVT